ncbi:Thioesterase/thiol ester dehydrase-isomerase [Lentinula edodes]|nr:Thioesterase/thiol ester dehydrase-isomerase [Lentinula edodes]
MFFRTLSNTKQSLRKSRRYNSVKALQAAFRDPSSPFYLAPGTKGPGSPEEYELPPDSTPESSNMQSDTSSFQQLVEQGRMKLVQAGFHHPTIWEQPIAWGDQDSFQHVNNVQYVRYFESSRILWMNHLGHRLGGPDEAEALRKGKGISLIIKSLNVNYRRPVTYPDTYLRSSFSQNFIVQFSPQLLISHKPVPPTQSAQLSNSVQQSSDPAALLLTSSAFSVTQQAFVAHCHETLVWYDYKKLRKSAPGEEYRTAVWEPYLQETSIGKD